ncbi:Uncharacterized protein TCM_012200 [Theobroma cacao]|uniref:Uncharacterized protein n=1 Tax=Theobroma cacao TaxID=3641 RepID=A0A061G1D8_THECC|nr:Uncharacterized protein TCM_012200 [Theobroma cacao]
MHHQTLYVIVNFPKGETAQYGSSGLIKEISGREFNNKSNSTVGNNLVDQLKSHYPFDSTNFLTQLLSTKSIPIELATSLKGRSPSQTSCQNLTTHLSPTDQCTWVLLCKSSVDDIKFGFQASADTFCFFGGLVIASVQYIGED